MPAPQGQPQGFADHWDDGAQMFAGGELGYDTAVFFVGVELGGHYRAEDVNAILYHSGRGLIARRFDAQNKNMDLSEFDYDLPEESIAQRPLPDRAGSRMLVLFRETQRWEDRMFRDFPSFLQAGDGLVLNDSKVFPSRLFGHRVGVHSLPVGKNNPKRHENLSGGVEVLLLRPVSADAKTWEALVRPGRKLRVGERIEFESMGAEIVARGSYGERTLRFDTTFETAFDTAFDTAEHIYRALDAIGHVPLPPYIKRPDTNEDRERYQTVFAKRIGSVAAPTAGLHFTSEIIEQCRGRGAQIVYVTLHVGLGTFQPVRSEKLHAEHFSISEEAAATIKAASRVICAGTTSVRAVESMLLGKKEETDLFIRPGFSFRRTDVMLTNFHLPQSSLLMLVCAFAGRELVLSAYRYAVQAGYRFYSYGDCMLVV